LSVPSFITDSALNTPDVDAFEGNMLPGAPMDDAPIHVNGQDAWLMDQMGHRFQCLVFVDEVGQLDASTRQALIDLADGSVSVHAAVICHHAGAIEGLPVYVDTQGLFAKRYDAQPGSVWLIRPDQHVCARARRFNFAWLKAALNQATCNV
jgi:3-(3-hydroxy-phenyl)propionate hydroxylase